MHSHPIRFNVVFPRNYEAKILESYSLLNPLEKLHHFPAMLEEGDRSGIYARVTAHHGISWIGFFAMGFESEHVARGLYSCPDPNSLCVVVGGYAYVINALHPEEWMQLEQRPVMDVRPIPESKLLLFIGATTISAVGESGQQWTTGRLSWEGITVSEIDQHRLRGAGWDALKDQEVPFEVDLITGHHTGGTRPGTRD
ncbi:MAG TPA: hypothetical protein VHA33_12615 [Candidatus Angelobacter sp.]|jgi:hypothetical protein|nr:hypothetical protein [Candidatus Angelobacter sp.]